MLELAKLDRPKTDLKLDAVSLSALFQRLWGTFRVIAHEKQIHLRIALKEGGNLTVRGDARLLERALDNLLGNAMKFTPPYGTVTLTGVRREGDVIFEVQDTGRISVEAQASLFNSRGHSDPKDPQAGYGLGLPMVKSIVEAHHGGISVQSKLGYGSCFSFWIPDTPAST